MVCYTPVSFVTLAPFAASVWGIFLRLKESQNPGLKFPEYGTLEMGIYRNP